jgi:peptidoglycan/LPS O-acetylase OafA/YrhL
MTTPQPRARSTTESNRTGELECIAFLRGLAALGVVFYHVRIDLWIGFATIQSHASAIDPFSRTMAWLSLPTPFLGSGVMLFFVISGFCIHFPYASPQGRSFSAVEYTVRRFFRIYPPYLVVVLFSLLVEWIVVQMGDLSTVNWKLNLLSAFMLQNWTGFQPVANPAFWTLPVEVEFYLLFPLIFWGLKSFSITWTVILSGVVTLISTAIYAAYGPLIAGHFALYWLMWVGGAALAELYQRKRLTSPRGWIIGLAFLFFIIALEATAHHLNSGNKPTPGRYGFIQDGLDAGIHLEFGLCFLVLIWWSVCNQGWYARIPVFIAGFLGLLGQISYSLYLIHMPLFFLCGHLWIHHFGTKPVNFLVGLPFCILAVAIAALLYKFVEEPSHFLGRSMARRLTGGKPSKP